MEIILREYLAGGGKPTANERNISLKKRPHPLFIFYPPCTIGLVGTPYIHLSYRFTRDLTTNGADVLFFSAENEEF